MHNFFSDLPETRKILGDMNLLVKNYGSGDGYESSDPNSEYTCNYKLSCNLYIYASSPLLQNEYVGNCMYKLQAQYINMYHYKL